ncbi:MAG: hypothetical protein JWM31_718, partial [Solirubrobacterales bacterium]|nr:hypothetical protein [Solirubrobacterales bacterium]
MGAAGTGTLPWPRGPFAFGALSCPGAELDLPGDEPLELDAGGALGADAELPPAGPATELGPLAFFDAVRPESPLEDVPAWEPEDEDEDEEVSPFADLADAEEPPPFPLPFAEPRPRLLSFREASGAADGDFAAGATAAGATAAGATTAGVTDAIIVPGVAGLGTEAITMPGRAPLPPGVPAAAPDGAGVDEPAEP